MFGYELNTFMYGIAITYAVASLLLLGGFAYITFKMTSKKWNAYYSQNSFWSEFLLGFNLLSIVWYFIRKANHSYSFCLLNRLFIRIPCNQK